MTPRYDFGKIFDEVIRSLDDLRIVRYTSIQ